MDEEAERPQEGEQAGISVICNDRLVLLNHTSMKTGWGDGTVMKTGWGDGTVVDITLNSGYCRLYNFLD